MLSRIHLLPAFAAMALLAACGDDSSTSPAPAPSSATGMHGITITAPNGGETFTAGDSITVKWTADPDSASDVGLILLCGSAVTETPLFTGSIKQEADEWGNVRVQLPSAPTGSCKIKIRDYQIQTNYDTTDARFTVNAR